MKVKISLCYDSLSSMRNEVMDMNEPWYVTSFQEDYLKIYSHRTDEAAKQEIEDIVAILNMRPGSKVLDLCCGNGRHSRELATLGFEVTGIDLSTVLLEEARKKNKELNINYIQSDVRKLSFSNDFDYVLNLFTSFGYFEERSENKKVFESIYHSLKKGGTFLIDFLNPGYIRSSLVPYSERHAEGLLIIEKRRIEGNTVIKDIEVKEDHAENRTYQEEVNLFEYVEMQSMLIECGLHVEQVIGSFKEEHYDVDLSPRMIIIGRKLE
jgi:SAM-dependent methyltransferase